jgi:hypothetical protein
VGTAPQKPQSCRCAKCKTVSAGATSAGTTALETPLTGNPQNSVKHLEADGREAATIADQTLQAQQPGNITGKRQEWRYRNMAGTFKDGKQQALRAGF